MTTNGFTLDTLTKTEEVVDLGMPDESLAQCFARIKADYPTLTMSRRHYESGRFNFERAYWRYGDRPDRSLTLGEVFAAWTASRLAEIDDHWSSEMDRILAAFVPNDPEASTMTYDEFCREMTRLERSCGVRRTNVTKAAYGITYKQFAEFTDDTEEGAI